MFDLRQADSRSIKTMIDALERELDDRESKYQEQRVK